MASAISVSDISGGIKKASITIFDSYKKDEYKLFNDCNKLEAILNNTNRTLLGKGTYAEVIKYCEFPDCSSGYALRKRFDEPERLKDPNDPYWTALRIGYLLNLFIVNNITPHIIPTLGNFVCNKSYITITPLIKGTEEGSDLHHNRSILSNNEIIRNILFQISFTLAAIQKFFPGFKHNDLTSNNILVSKVEEGGFFLYKINNLLFRVPNMGYRFYISDYDLSCIPGIIDNNFLPILDSAYNVTDAYDPSYDLACINEWLWQLSPLYEEEVSNTLGVLRMVETNALGKKEFIYDKATHRPLFHNSSMTPMEALKSSIFNIYRISTIGDMSKYIDFFDANTIPKLETSSLMKQFDECYSSFYFLPRDESKIRSMPQAILKDKCKYEGVTLAYREIYPELTFLEDPKSEQISRDPYYHRHYNRDELKDLINFIYLEVCTDYLHYVTPSLPIRFYRSALEKCIDAKIYVYFNIKPNLDTPYLYEILKDYRFLYQLIPIDQFLIDRFIDSQSNKFDTIKNISDVVAPIVTLESSTTSKGTKIDSE